MNARNRVQRRLILMLMVFACFSVHAQMIGNPVGNQGQGAWSLSATASFMNQDVGTEKAISQRFLVKSTYGIMPWLDLVAMLGTADLTLNSPKKEVADLESKTKFAYGLGLTLTPKRETPDQPLAIIGGGHFLRFPAEGIFHETNKYDPDVPAFNREFRMKYDWKEYLVFGGLSYRINNLRLYGFGVGWGLSRPEEKTEYQYETGGTPEFIGKEKATFQPDLWTGALVGIEFTFPTTKYVLSAEALLYNEENFVLMVGIGQTGIGESGW